MKVPAELLTGHHEQVRKSRRRDALLRTLRRRPELLAQAELSAPERRWLMERGWQTGAPNPDSEATKPSDDGGPPREGTNAGRPRRLGRTTRSKRSTDPWTC